MKADDPTNKILDLIKQDGRGTAEFLRVFGLNPTALSKWKCGEVPMSLGRAGRILDYLGLPWAALDQDEAGGVRPGPGAPVEPGSPRPGPQ